VEGEAYAASKISGYEGHKAADSIRTMKAWLRKYGIWPEVLREIKFTGKKKAATIIIDDRTICFRGSYKGLTKKILEFEPWHKKGIWGEDETNE